MRMLPASNVADCRQSRVVTISLPDKTLWGNAERVDVAVPAAMLR
jgi:hypothetical protein